MAESQEKKFDRDEAITFPKLSFETTIPIAVVASILYSIGGAIMDGYNCKDSFIFIVDICRFN